MRATLAVLLMVLCAGAASAGPADPVPFEHWAYDAVVTLDDALQCTLLQSWRQARQQRTLTRYESAMLALTALDKLRDSEITAEEAANGRLGETWRRLALEFLPEMIDVGEELLEVRHEHDRPDMRWIGDVPPDYLANNAMVTLRSVPYDHWLYPEAQRVLWAAAEMEYTDAPRVEDVTPADTVPLDHWAYQSALRLDEVTRPGASDRSFIGDRALTRYEFAFVADRALHELRKAEAPTAEQQDLAVTWALLALEFWPELEALNAPVIPGTEAAAPGQQAPVLAKGNELPEGHWLYPTVMRVLQIGRASTPRPGD